MDFCIWAIMHIAGKPGIGKRRYNMDRYICQKNLFRRIKAALLNISLITVLLLGTSCSNGQENKPENRKIPVTEGKFLHNELEIKGQRPEAETEINADDIPGVNDNSFYVQIANLQSSCCQIEQLLKGTYGYAKEYKELTSIIEYLFEKEKKSGKNKRKKVYIMPVFAWDYKWKKICYDVPFLIIYSKNLDKIYECYTFRKEDGDKFPPLNFGEIDSVYKKALEENPEREFLVIYNKRYHFCLRNKNKTTGAELYDLEIKGGYYKKLKEFGIGISFKKLIDDKNLYEFDI